MDKIKILKKDKSYDGFNKINNYLFEFNNFTNTQKLLCEKEIFERKDAIAIVLYDDVNDKLLLIQQFRPGCYIKKNIMYPFEIVAGLIDKNESMEQTIIREAKEESSAVITKIIKLCSFFPEISFSTREIHIFCGKFDSTKIKEFAGLKSEGEDTKISLFSSQQVRSILRKNEIINSHTIIGLQYFFSNFKNIIKKFREEK